MTVSAVAAAAPMYYTQYAEDIPNGQERGMLHTILFLLPPQLILGLLEVPMPPGTPAVFRIMRVARIIFSVGVYEYRKAICSVYVWFCPSGRRVVWLPCYYL